jgi:hypothetical protein
MRSVSTFLVLIVLSAITFGQQEVTIRDIQFVEADSLLFYGPNGAEPTPPLEGQTVTVEGVVMNQAYYGQNSDSARFTHHGAPAVWINDPNNREWGGIIIRDPEGSADFAILDSGFVIKVTGEVSTYLTTTQINATGFTAANVVGIQARPKAVNLTLDSLFLSDGSPNYLAEKWEGVYVEFNDLIVTENNTLGNNSFTVADASGKQMVVYTTGDYFRNFFPQPIIGASLSRLRGIIDNRTDATWFIINPIYDGDVTYGDVSPPNILDVERDKAIVGFGEDVVITANVFDADGTGEVTSVKLNYSSDGTNFTEVDMTLTNEADSIWSATIPGFNDSTFVSYYIYAEDADQASSISPNGGAENPYTYFVLNRPLTIAEVQYSPFGSGFSSYNNYEVTVSGIVTADTSNIEGDGNNIGPQVYIQDGNGPWSGIQIFGTEADNLQQGDDVTVTGIVNESFGLTRIGNLTNGVTVIVNQSGVELPEPVVLTTDVINGASGNELPAEQYEGMLLSFINPFVVDDNADGNSGPDEGSGGNRNFGEILIADESTVSMRVEMQDGTHDYNNYWDFLQDGSDYQVATNDTFDEIRGILFFSFGNYKLVPRSNEDFIGWSGTTVGVEDETLPFTYALEQNYPNPFNPSTAIKYSLKEAGLVNIKVYNIVGQEVLTLVNNIQQAGNHSINFDASSLASGIYMYQITVNDFVSVKKMMLLK